MTDPAGAVPAIWKEKITCLVGLLAQINPLARYRAAASIPPGQLTSVPLTADWVPQAIIAALVKINTVRCSSTMV